MPKKIRFPAKSKSVIDLSKSLIRDREKEIEKVELI